MMSMLSAQCDELRAMAEIVGLTMPQAATLMMEAADTILSLRDRAQVLQAENAKLQASNEVIAEDHAALCEHNAKLRELARDMLHDAMENVCSKAYWCGEKNWQMCNDKECGNRLYIEMARELGVG